MPVNKRSRKGKQGFGKQQAIPVLAVAAAAEATATAVASQSHDKTTHNNSNNSSNNNNKLVLTSDQRRGVFECDYCHSDISQQPRIRCAVCDDFDLCCDCFVSTTTRASTSQQTQPQQQQHDPRTHGYRVCDSTRYPLFPVRATIKTSTSSKRKTIHSNNNNSMTLSPVPMDTTMEGDDTPPPTLILSPSDDPKQLWWTVEEDLRLLKGIDIHGLGNWADVAEAVAGPGSAGKTPRRCLERYWDDFLGRYGHIVPSYTLVPLGDQQEEDTTLIDNNITVSDPTEAAFDECTAEVVEESASACTSMMQGSTEPPPVSSKTSTADPVTTTTTTAAEDSIPTTAAATLGGGDSIRASKRRAAMLRSPSSMSRASEGVSSSSNFNMLSTFTASTKQYKAVPTESLPEYRQFFPNPYLPEWDNSNRTASPVLLGQEVGRDQAMRAEQAYARAIASLEAPEQVEKVRQDWERNRLQKPGGPTVLPLRVDDIPNLPGSELVGFMPRRGDFDVEWENNAEESIADMEFIPGESEQDRQLKLQVLAIYNSKLDEREKRKNFVLRRKLHDYRQHQLEYQKLPRDERDLLHRMRLFERFHTPAEHQQFIADLLQAKRLRKEIAKLQMYRRMGIRTLLDAERYELDKARRHFHKHARLQKDMEARKAETAAAAAAVGEGHPHVNHESSLHYWKQYRTGERKIRRSINRGDSSSGGMAIASMSLVEQDSIQYKDPPAVTAGVVASADGAKLGGAAYTQCPITAIDTTATITTTDNDAMDVDTTPHNGNSNETNKPTLKKSDDHDGEDDDAKPPATATAVSLPPPQTTTAASTAATTIATPDMAQMPGYALLSPREVELCRSVQLQPAQYLEIKKALIAESLMQGLLDDRQKQQQRNISSNTSNSSGKLSQKKSHFQRSLVKIDVERHGAVVDFVVRAGWIPTVFGQSVREGRM